ncbi:ABC-type transport system involved in cytochrome c biogenesis permease component [Sphingomonas sp. BE138]|nr:ABC-type transport system involved in cytochrome c biogenesis permease component [Sphingomonas sp. BE138]
MMVIEFFVRMITLLASLAFYIYMIVKDGMPSSTMGALFAFVIIIPVGFTFTVCTVYPVEIALRRKSLILSVISPPLVCITISVIASAIFRSNASNALGNSAILILIGMYWGSAWAVTGLLYFLVKKSLSGYTKKSGTANDV